MRNMMMAVITFAVFSYTGAILAEPRIAISLNEGKKTADLQVILIDTDSNLLNYSTLEVKINDVPVNQEQFDDAVTQMVIPSALVFKLAELLEVPGSYHIQVQIENIAGEVGYLDEFFELNQASSLNDQLKKISWSSIWKTAKKLAAKGVASALIKSYLERNGYRCPPGPWWLCARSAGG